MELAVLGRSMAVWSDSVRQSESARTGDTAAQESLKNGGLPTAERQDSPLPPVRQEGRAEQDGARSSLQKPDTGACETCQNRKYQDGSNDPGVSCKTPTRFDPDTAASAVRSHELEHVGREQDKARETGRKVVSQSVTYHTAICPECGKVYVSGGETRTVTKNRTDLASLFQTGLPESEPQVGKYFSAIA